MSNTNLPLNNKRDVDGVILLDKATGISSNKALQQLKHLFQATKAGHTGSLDPLASGMLPICFGEATKFSQNLLEADKAYQVIAKLGVTTASADREGEILTVRSVPNFSHQQLEDVFQQFRGTITQVPSMYSALKFQGQPLYKLARKGIEISRPVRQIHIYDLKLLQRTDTTLKLDVTCSKGTYIRNLVEDIGAALGCGAHVSYLHRYRVGTYQAEQMWTFAQLQAFVMQEPGTVDNILLPIDSGLSNLPLIKLSCDETQALKCGQAITPNETDIPGPMRLYYDHKFVGIGEINVEGKLTARRLLNTSKFF